MPRGRHSEGIRSGRNKNLTAAYVPRSSTTRQPREFLAPQTAELHRSELTRNRDSSGLGSGTLVLDDGFEAVGAVQRAFFADSADFSVRIGADLHADKNCRWRARRRTPGNVSAAARRPWRARRSDAVTAATCSTTEPFSMFGAWKRAEVGTVARSFRRLGIVLAGSSSMGRGMRGRLRDRIEVIVACSWRRNPIRCLQEREPLQENPAATSGLAAGADRFRNVGGGIRRVDGAAILVMAHHVSQA